MLTESAGNVTSVKPLPALAGPALSKPETCEQSVVLGLGVGRAVDVESAAPPVAVGDAAPVWAVEVADALHALSSRTSVSSRAGMSACGGGEPQLPRERGGALMRRSARHMRSHPPDNAQRR